jgi:DNA helicase HerA-like ATPase
MPTLSQLVAPQKNGHTPTNPQATSRLQSPVLGVVAADTAAATNEQVAILVPMENRKRAVRGRFVRIEDKATDTEFLGRVIAGPFFADDEAGDARLTVEIQGELTNRRTRDSGDRPTAGATVRELVDDRVGELLGCSGDMFLGTLIGTDGLAVGLQSKSKDVLPRNVGIFGTVGSGKSNTSQVLIEEAAKAGWAVIILDVEGEYVGMDAPADVARLTHLLSDHGIKPAGVPDFRVLHPAGCASERPDSKTFTLRLADLETPILTEIIQATMAERNALLDCVEHFLSKAYSRTTLNEADRLAVLLDPTPGAPRPFTLQQLTDRARERSPRTTELIDFLGLANKLLALVHSGVFDQPTMHSLDPAGMLVAGRVTVVDVSVANDIIKNIATADLLRKAFTYKILKEAAPPTLVVIEEAHSFISKEKAQTMAATLQMLRNVTRRGRKRWFATAFVSQQPGHLPAEIFELCNTRLVHTLRSMHNLESLMATTSDITGDLWARCPLLGTGEAIVSSPQLHRPAVVSIRPAASRRKFAR